jgi:hypothetical protein
MMADFSLFHGFLGGSGSLGLAHCSSNGVPCGLRCRGRGGLGSDIRDRDIVGHVKGEITAYMRQGGDDLGMRVRCSIDQRNRTCGEERGSEYEGPD